MLLVQIHDQAINNSESRQISILQARGWIRQTWSEVTSTTIGNYFYHSGIEISCNTNFNQENND